MRKQLFSPDVYITLAALFPLAVTATFVLLPQAAAPATTIAVAADSTTRLDVASRRELLAGIVDATAAAAAGTVLIPQVAHSADVDYSKIQDLLGPNGGVTSYTAAPQAGKRPMYLEEPTQEFKDNESRAAEFKRKNLQYKSKFASVLDRVTTVPNDEAAITLALDEMRRMVKSNGGLPTGITKEEVVKTCRRRKSKKFWPKDVEIAYVVVCCT
jgi:hypothetical protein